MFVIHVYVYIYIYIYTHKAALVKRAEEPAEVYYTMLYYTVMYYTTL